MADVIVDTGDGLLERREPTQVPLKSNVAEREISKLSSHRAAAIKPYNDLSDAEFMRLSEEEQIISVLLEFERQPKQEVPLSSTEISDAATAVEEAAPILHEAAEEIENDQKSQNNGAEKVESESSVRFAKLTLAELNNILQERIVSPTANSAPNLERLSALERHRLAFPEYEIKAKIAETPRCVVYEAVRKSDDYECVLKVANTKDESLAALNARQLLIENSHFRLFSRVNDAFPKSKKLFSAVTNDVALEVERFKTLDESWLDACSVEEKLVTFLQILDAVHFLHEAGYVVADIKPKNIGIGPSGKIGIIDLKGIKHYDRSKAVPGLQDTLEHSLSMCVSGEVSQIAAAVHVTPGWAAPEQLVRTHLPQSDIYALGKLLYWVHTENGKRNIDAGMSLKGELTPLNAIIEGCRYHNPTDRYQDIPALKQAIEENCAPIIERYRAITAKRELERNLLERIAALNRDPAGGPVAGSLHHGLDKALAQLLPTLRQRLGDSSAAYVISALEADGEFKNLRSKLTSRKEGEIREAIFGILKLERAGDLLAQIKPRDGELPDFVHMAHGLISSGPAFSSEEYRKEVREALQAYITELDQFGHQSIPATTHQKESFVFAFLRLCVIKNEIDQLNQVLSRLEEGQSSEEQFKSVFFLLSHIRSYVNDLRGLKRFETLYETIKTLLTFSVEELRKPNLDHATVGRRISDIFKSRTVRPNLSYLREMRQAVNAASARIGVVTRGMTKDLLASDIFAAFERGTSHQPRGTLESMKALVRREVGAISDKKERIAQARSIFTRLTHLKLGSMQLTETEKTTIGILLHDYSGEGTRVTNELTDILFQASLKVDERIDELSRYCAEHFLEYDNEVLNLLQLRRKKVGLMAKDRMQELFQASQAEPGSNLQRFLRTCKFRADLVKASEMLLTLSHASGKLAEVSLGDDSILLLNLAVANFRRAELGLEASKGKFAQITNALGEYQSGPARMVPVDEFLAQSKMNEDLELGRIKAKEELSKAEALTEEALKTLVDQLKESCLKQALSGEEALLKGYTDDIDTILHKVIGLGDHERHELSEWLTGLNDASRDTVTQSGLELFKGDKVSLQRYINLGGAALVIDNGSSCRWFEVNPEEDKEALLKKLQGFAGFFKQTEWNRVYIASKDGQLKVLG